jgi:predicted ribosome quality control (RQC) complex YloA/Tae2 family protein
VGRHSNLVLLGPSERVLDVLVPPPATQEKPRLSLGKAYVPPPGRARTSTAENPALAKAFPAPTSEPTLRRHETSNPAPLSWIVENALGSQAEEARIARERRELVERLERKAKNARSLVHGLEARLAASRDAERVSQDGELLKANLSRVARGAKSISVEDFFDPEAKPRSIALDPKLSANENLERIFERAKKLERSGLVVEEELALARAKLARLDQFLARANAPGADFDALALEAASERILDEKQIVETKRKHDPAPRVPYKTFHGADGSEIRVGRSAKDNDDLTFRHASGNDLWFHTADTPGSHVVLRMKTPEPHPEEVLDAAHLAVQFSPLEGARVAKVHVARRKEVHKPRRAKPGLVTLSGGKILEVRMQPERLKRLLGTHRPPGSS